MENVELIYQNNVTGHAHELSTIVESLDYTTTRIGNPAKLELSLINGYETALEWAHGSPIAFKYGGAGIFYGYLFNVATDKNNQKLVFYDQLRYLIANATYVFSGATLKYIIESIARDFELRTGVIDSPSYVIKPLSMDNKKILDIIYSAMDEVLVNQRQMYILFDDFGSLSLRKPQDMVIPYVLGDGSLATAFSHNASIDESYNYVKLVRDNKDTGKRDTYIVKDSTNMKKWGKLQLFEVVDEKMNAGQIEQRATMLMEMHNRVKQSLTIEGIGDFNFIAGKACYVDLEKAKKYGYHIIEEAHHTLKGNQHNMSLKMKVI